MTIEQDDWDREWDSRSHTSDEYRREIRELRQRTLLYSRGMDSLRLTAYRYRDALQRISASDNNMVSVRIAQDAIAFAAPEYERVKSILREETTWKSP